MKWEWNHTPCPEPSLEPPEESRAVQVARLLEELDQLETQWKAKWEEIEGQVEDLLHPLHRLEQEMEQVAQELGDLGRPQVVRHVYYGG